MKQAASIRHVARVCAGFALLSAASLTPLVPLAEAEEDIRDIRGPKAVQGSWLLTAVLVGVIIVGLALCLIWRHRARGGGTARQALSLSERTLAALESAKQLMRPATAREFGIAASAVIRTYIEKRFHLIATQRTTEEFLQALLQSSNTSLAHHRALLEQFLNQCDLVKFAGTSPALADMESLLASARRFVSETSESPVA